ncbi:tRNA glutamyl-Q(34) synthetase GluQRS [Pragia fontium]|uniref:Glutamyl-Q tRNA(Asp) synthetase n=1 Tax=Pragia fontium TaxID=82985 RepID=A0ABQ5LMT7_9GAMM|nr:tRNA glutamyl-Q(34) synthetase GluQRS [Pragia fontium]AKJ42940.1 glutamyl-Q tRNA(Asp) ligase [Pragia fontium]GKX63938.1 glutamyl-Q tRNA(Asp) synthetase [Pragia fontium]SUB83356.1 Glutamyl-Q tRNA(Asp) synthetase [Pragia fontium]VEJ56252.1 Glutamyl-Q tRNA(Asp) synthetase [Pragia fontium]
MTNHYVGRFAPSPSGDLHFGSLIAALGSFLQARSNHGNWLVRIEDIDPPREVAGAAARILNTLEYYGLHWDGEVLYQSQRSDAYKQVLHDLYQRDLCYYCHCSRTQIQHSGGIYDRHCRNLNLPPEEASTRLRLLQPVYSFEDRHLGKLCADSAFASEDFIIHRKDGLFAYNLAVVIDDHFQGMTEIVRGADLIEPTVRQIALYRLLGWHEPDYFHLPLALSPDGNKLSKQNHARPLPLDNPLPILAKAIAFLGQSLPESWQDASLEALLTWAVKHWDSTRVPKQPALTLHFPFSNGAV